METKSAEQANGISSAAMIALGFWSGHQKETCQDVRRAGTRKGPLSEWEVTALDANVYCR
jgi:hypothetical protein